jgi:hypothetical protein
MWAFMPKYICWPFLLECMSGSGVWSLFLVELGAAIRVASTSVAAFRSRPWALSSSLTVAKIWSASLCFSSLGRKRRMVLSSGKRPNSYNWANSRYSGVSKKASSIHGSDSVSHCCMKCTRSMASKESGGRGLFGLQGSRGQSPLPVQPRARLHSFAPRTLVCVFSWLSDGAGSLLVSCKEWSQALSAFSMAAGELCRVSLSHQASGTITPWA